MKIFVFDSNLAGRHVKGSALFALHYHAAKNGVGAGITGNAYALPTKDEHLLALPLDSIIKHVEDFLEYARTNPGLEFQVTKIGCGLAGYSEFEIAPLFRNAPSNCELPQGWR